VRRREFLPILGGVAVTWPLSARAQQPTTSVIGFLRAGSAKEAERRTAAFRQGLSEVGYIEGKNLRIEERSAEGRYDRLAELAAELVRLRVDLIFASAMPSALAVKAASTSIPIVFTTAADPVAYGLLRNISRPEGNLTGVTSFSGALVAKHLELIHDLVPKAATIGLLVNPTSPTAEIAERDIQSAASVLGRRIRVSRAGNQRDLVVAFANLAEIRVAGLIVAADPSFDSWAEHIVSAAARLRVPAIYHLREYVEAGGLMSYSSSVLDVWRQAGIYAGRILKGAKPADLPVLHPTKYELFLNLKTAKALGITIPESILLRADEVIE